MIKTLQEDARSCEQKMSLRDRTRRSKAVKLLMSEGFRELKRTCPLCYRRGKGQEDEQEIQA